MPINMFLSLIGEFVLGFYTSDCVVRFDATTGLLAFGASLISEVTFSAGELTELSVDEFDEIIEVAEVSIELAIATLSLLLDVTNAGVSIEGFTAVLEFSTTLSDALSIITNVRGIGARFEAFVALFSESTSPIETALVVLEIISTVLRPISLALRIFANLTSGVLISSLSSTGATATTTGLLLTSVCGSSELSLFSLSNVTIFFSTFESVIGVIQSAVYFILAIQYARTARN